MAYYWMKRVPDSSPDKTGQGHLHSTLCLASNSYRPAARISDVDNSDSSDAESSYPSSPSPLPTKTLSKTSPTACATCEDNAYSPRCEKTPATVVEASVNDHDQKLADVTEEFDWQEHSDSDAEDGSLDDQAVEAIESHGIYSDEGVYSASGRLLDSPSASQLEVGSEEYADRAPDIDDELSDAYADEASLELHELHDSDEDAQSTVESYSPEPQSYQTTTAFEQSPLLSFGHPKDLRTAESDAAEDAHLYIEDEEGTDSDCDSLGSLSPLTVISSPASSLGGIEEGEAASPPARECDKVRSDEDRLLSPLPSLGYLADIMPLEVTMFLLWSASPCACPREGMCSHLGSTLFQAS